MEFGVEANSKFHLGMMTLGVVYSHTGIQQVPSWVSLRGLNFLLLTALKYSLWRPPTANRQPLPTANRHQLPTATNRQLPTANCRQPPTFEVEIVP